MDWIIRNSDKMEFHTHLNIILLPIIDDLKDINWLISNLEYHIFLIENLLVNHKQDYFMLLSKYKNVPSKHLTFWGHFKEKTL